MNARPHTPDPEPIAPNDEDVRAAQAIAADLYPRLSGDDFDRLCLHLAMHRLRGQIEVHTDIRNAAAMGLTGGTA